MVGRTLVATGLLVVIVGVIFSLQGFGVLGGSAMSGSSFWAAAGPVIAIAGLLVAAVGVRRVRVSAPKS
jgi:hypothetical protein